MRSDRARTWRTATASYAEGNCVEAAARWRKSSYSDAAETCTEVGQDGDGVLVRDTEDRGGPVLSFSGRAWREFMSQLRG